MSKVLVVALREYNAAVRTKAFVIGLLMMPLLMGGSILAGKLFGNQRDVRERKLAVIDRTPGAAFKGSLVQALAAYNANRPKDEKTDKYLRGEILLEAADVLTPADEAAYDAAVVELKARTKSGKLMGYLDIGKDVTRVPEGSPREKPPAAGKVVYVTYRLPDREFLGFVEHVMNKQVREVRSAELKLSPVQVELASREVPFEVFQETFQAAIFVPLILMMLMFMLIMMSATPLMQGVVEEKMQRIAEVLLGSVSPFQLMLGKLVGMTGVSLTIAAVYLGGAYWAARSNNMAEFATPSLVAWFLLYQTLASLMFGSLFIAVGAACSDMRETQNLLWPIMLLATMPMFLFSLVIQSPNGPVVTAVSFFPFATPSLMLARHAMPPGIETWQLVVGAVGMLVTTLVCVWAAGRIFRVGILMMGKGATPLEMARWVFRG